MMKKYLLLLLLLSNFVIAESQHVLRVGVFNNLPPFAYINSQGHLTGLSVELWRETAKKAHLKYKFYPQRSSYDNAIKMVQEGKYDTFIGPISVTHNRLNIVSFSRPYFIDRVSLAVNRDKISFFDVIMATFGTGLLLMFAVFFILLFIFTVILWRMERNNNPKMNKHVLPGLAEALWAMVTSFLRDLVYSPATQQARALLSLWLIISVIFMSMITAIVTASLTHAMDKNQVRFKTPYDLLDQKIAFAKGSDLYDSLAKQYNMVPVRSKELRDSLNLLDQKKVRGVMGDHFLLRYAIEHNDAFENDLQLSNLIISNDEYAFPFTLNNHKIRHKVDRAITYLQKVGEASHVCARTLGLRYQNSCQL